MNVLTEHSLTELRVSDLRGFGLSMTALSDMLSYDLAPRCLARPILGGSIRQRRLRMAGRIPTSYDDDKEALLRRLRKMEGQVRGIAQMIADDRYCLDVVQQINSLTAAAREVALLVLEDHLKGCVADAIKADKGDAAIKEMVTVLGKALRQ